MPAWLQFILGLSAALAALGVIGQKLLKPLWRAGRRIEDALPLMADLTTQLQDTPQAFAVLKEIIAEFRSDSGSTAKDSLNRLEVAVDLLIANADTIRISAEAARQLSERDREQTSRIIREQDRTSTKLDSAVQTLMAMVADRRVVAASLVTREQQVDAASGQVAANLVNREQAIDTAAGLVADELAASQQRAGSVTDAPAGAAADAAAGPPGDAQEAEAEDDAATDAWVAGVHAERRSGGSERPGGLPTVDTPTSARSRAPVPLAASRAGW